MRTSEPVLIRSGRVAVLGLAVTMALTLGARLSGQSPTARTNDDVLTELRALRTDLKEFVGLSIRTQVLTAQLQLQEQRIESIARQLAEAREKQTASESQRALFAGQLKMLRESNEGPATAGADADALRPLITMLAEMEKRSRELQAQTGSLEPMLATELTRWSDIGARLEQVERDLAARVAR